MPGPTDLKRRRRWPWVIAGLAASANSLAAEPNHWADEIIYFVMVDRFADGDPTNNAGADPANPLAFHGGDLAGVTAQLDDIASLGATALWITPVVQQIAGPIPSDAGPFWGHHGYWANDFTRIDPRYGTESDLTALVDAAHARGLKVLLDVVYNHVGYGASWTVTHPDWLRQGDDCGADDVTLCLAGLPDLRTDLPAVRDHLFDAHMGLAARTGLDGFRLDTFRHLEPEFWAAHRDAVRDRLGPDFFLLGEIWDGDRFLAEAPFADATLDGLIDFSFRDRVLKFLTGVTDAERFGRYLAARHDVQGGVLAPFLSSHDMPMLLAMLRGDTGRMRVALALLMLAEGPPIIAWGEEVGRAGGVWPDNRDDMPWPASGPGPGDGLPRDDDLRADLAALIALRRADAGFHTGPLQVLGTNVDAMLLQRGEYLVAINRGPDGAAVGAMGVPDGNWRLIHGPGPDSPFGAARLPGPGVSIWQRD